MKSIIVILAIISCFSYGLGETEAKYKEEFLQFIQKYQRNYVSEKEYNMRFQNFKNNMDFIARHNANPEYTFSVAMNQFGDWSHEEYSSILHDLKAPVHDDLPNTAEEYDTRLLPTNWDWRAKGAVTPIKNQLQCGSSPYFAAVVSIEGCHQTTTGNLVSLSEQQILVCSDNEGNQGCDGGEMTFSFQYVMQQGGIDTESCYPYTSNDSTACQFKPNRPCCGSTVTSYVNVTPNSESALQNAVYLAPVATIVNADSTEFQLYSHGIFNLPNCTAEQANHGIAVVGYGVNGTDYWILKNSWGTSWGMEGFMYIARNAGNMCGIADMPSYAQQCFSCPSKVSLEVK